MKSLRQKPKKKIYVDEYSSRIRPPSGQWGVKVVPSFCIGTPRVSGDTRPRLSQPCNEAPLTEPRPQDGVPQSPETKPLRPRLRS